MKAETINQLRKLERDDISGLPRAEFVARFHLKQLLDEREALMEAAKDALAADLAGLDPLESLQAAVAKAESP